MVRALIIGSDTPVGRLLQARLESRGGQVQALTRSESRFRSERQAKKAVRRAKCDFVVDTRAQAAVDGGVRLHDVDIDRSHWLAKACQGVDQTYVTLSCARVFSGESTRPYAESDPLDTQETVGQLLVAAEEGIRARCERHVILRLGPVFAADGVNVLTHLLDKLVAGGTVQLGSHLRGSPMPAADAARVVSGLLDQFSTGIENWGSYHYCSSEPTTCFEFAEVLLASASQFSEFHADAVQLDSEEAGGGGMLSRVLDCSHIRDSFAIKQLPWRSSIAPLVREYFQPR